MRNVVINHIILTLISSSDMMCVFTQLLYCIRYAVVDICGHNNLIKAIYIQLNGEYDAVVINYLRYTVALK